jgi:hypothetical protein
MVDGLVSSESNTLTWSDVEDAAELAFRGFEHPGLEFGALEWANQAWEILIQAGLATYSINDELERSQVVIRFLALAGFYIEFRSVAWEEYVEPDYYGWARTLKFFHYDAVHYYAEELLSPDSDWSVLDDEDIELEDSDLQKLADNVREEVLSALTDSFGNISRLFVFLWQSNLPEAEEDGWVPDEIDSEILKYDIALNKQAAFEWLTQQCSTKFVEEAEAPQKNTLTECTQTGLENLIDKAVKLECPFSIETFDLLDKLHKKPTLDFYLAHEEEFKQYVEKPFQKLLFKVVNQLHDKITKWIDRQNELFGYPRWDLYYEGNLYPKRDIRFAHQFNELDSARLTLILSDNSLIFGLFIPDNSENKKRYLKNLQQFSNFKVIQELKLSSNCTLHRSKQENYPGSRLSDWLKNTYRKNTPIPSIQATVHLNKDRVIKFPWEQLTEQIKQTFEELFPLFLMAICDHPMAAIREYLNPIYQFSFSFSYQSNLLSRKTQQKQESNLSQGDDKLSVVHRYVKPSFPDICQNVLAQGLRISKSNLRRYHLALKTKGFAILSGISGTGKTWLTKAYAEAVKAEYLPVPVAPNWTTNEDLLGYFNPIDKEYYHTAFSHFLQKATEEYEQAGDNARPYHLVLDEMNLARVEYYFAKFLSAMEVRMREGVAQIELAPDKQVLLPPNLYFIGTVNVDETTHSFADKVYDRAQLIELEAPRQDLYEHLGEVPYREMLMQIWDEVHTVAPFAFRVIDEIKTYVNEAEALDVSWQDALDEQLLQKILPKLKGSDDRVGVALKAFVDIVNDQEFPLSHKKATKMLETFNQHGFTSYF